MRVLNIPDKLLMFACKFKSGQKFFQALGKNDSLKDLGGNCSFHTRQKSQPVHHHFVHKKMIHLRIEICVRRDTLLYCSLPTENSIDIGHEIHMINGIFWRTRKNDHMSVSTHSIFTTNTLAYWPHCCKNVRNELLTHRSFQRYLWNVSIHILSPKSNFEFNNHTKQPQGLIIIYQPIFFFWYWL